MAGKSQAKIQTHSGSLIACAHVHYPTLPLRKRRKRKAIKKKNLNMPTSKAAIFH